MDYYRILGLDKSATKSEIKDAFRKLAIKFHPDKHTASSKSVKDSATLKFKQVSEAYDVLSDDRKRADYNLRHSGFTSRTSSSSASSSNYNNGYSSGRTYTHSNHNKGFGYGYSPYNNGFASKFEKFARYLTTRDFLLHATFLGIILGGTLIIDKSRALLWNLQNSGKSFEAAMDNIQKAKADKDKE